MAAFLNSCSEQYLITWRDGSHGVHCLHHPVHRCNEQHRTNCSEN